MTLYALEWVCYNLHKYFPTIEYLEYLQDFAVTNNIFLSIFFFSKSSLVQNLFSVTSRFKHVVGWAHQNSSAHVGAMFKRATLGWLA